MKITKKLYEKKNMRRYWLLKLLLKLRIFDPYMMATYTTQYIYQTYNIKDVYTEFENFYNKLHEAKTPDDFNALNKNYEYILSIPEKESIYAKNLLIYTYGITCKTQGFDKIMKNYKQN